MTLLGILIDLKNAVVWINSIPPLISNSSIFLPNVWGTVPSALTKIGITDALIFHSFFSFPGKG